MWCQWEEAGQSLAGNTPGSDGQSDHEPPGQGLCQRAEEFPGSLLRPPLVQHLRTRAPQSAHCQYNAVASIWICPYQNEPRSTLSLSEELHYPCMSVQAMRSRSDRWLRSCSWPAVALRSKRQWMEGISFDPGKSTGEPVWVLAPPNGDELV